MGVEQWDGADRHVDDLIGIMGDYQVAKAAFDRAVRERPGRIITLRPKARLIADSGRGRDADIEPDDANGPPCG